MNARLKSAVAWIAFAVVSLIMFSNAFFNLSNLPGEFVLYEIADVAIQTLQPIVFALVGALIISRQPGNVIGLLLMVIPIAGAIIIPIESYLAAAFPDAAGEPTAFLFLALWLNSWSWLLLAIPILFILVLFPTGKPFTPRWRLLLLLGFGVSLLLIMGNVLAEEISTDYGTIANPIGFLSLQELDRYLSIPFMAALVILIIGCPTALLVRYRRTDAVERQQIKWLFLAGALFAAAFLLNLVTGTVGSYSPWLLLFELSVLTIPLAIGIAVLRYRLYDIDVIIRRTLQYGLLTAVLIAVYFGAVVVAQSAFVALTGQENALAIVLSTLLIAALFNPLRRRLQAFIDRRFYRGSYDAAQTLAAFARTTRDEVQLAQLRDMLLRSVNETMQPERAGLWLKTGEE